MSHTSPLIEVCVDSTESAQIAERAGADRIVLVDGMVEGGTTPSAGMISVCRKNINTPILVMIRPRSSDFCYSDAEFEAMKYDIEMAKSLGAYGVVLGVLTKEGAVDIERTKILVNCARPLQVTFNRAFDVCQDPNQALEDLISLGVQRVMTSGQAETAYDGMDMIAKLVERAKGRITIVACAGIHERNIKKILAQTGAIDAHVSLYETYPSTMTHRRAEIYMGGAVSGSPYQRRGTSEEKIRKIMNNAH
ncbi:uncharacterized protein VTP21DRAFT_6537 [Calcarisporiella thermophila]|uniref:uncharacterized protein n=1 Tax=Calcarisporiella thermophila TaxID=911321 RepID=UPI0037429B60